MARALLNRWRCIHRVLSANWGGCSRSRRAGRRGWSSGPSPWAPSSAASTTWRSIPAQWVGCSSPSAQAWCSSQEQSYSTPCRSDRLPQGSRSRQRLHVGSVVVDPGRSVGPPVQRHGAGLTKVDARVDQLLPARETGTDIEGALRIGRHVDRNTCAVGLRSCERLPSRLAIGRPDGGSGDRFTRPVDQPQRRCPCRYCKRQRGEEQESFHARDYRPFRP